MKKYLALFIFLLIGMHGLRAQTTSLLARVDFENMDASDSANQGTSVVVNGSPAYACGVNGDAIELSGNDFLLLNGTVNNVFGSSDFTLSFYFKPTNFAATQDIISKRQACTNQRAFAVRFAPASMSLEIIIAENATKETNFILPLPQGRCWYHLAITKATRTTTIYINGEQVAQDNAVARIDLDNPESLVIANGPCIGVTDERFEGLIDELLVFDMPLDRESIESLYTEPDAINARDTLIFLGGSVPLSVANTCSNDIFWRPSAEMDDASSPTTTFRPGSEGTYMVAADFRDGLCTASDTIRVVVVDPANLDCEKIFLANAFTPNGDGINDQYGIDNPFAIEKLNKFEIFDRLGNIVFSTTDMFGSWDGRYQSNVVSPGVFVYRVNYDCRGEALTTSGSFSVLK